MEGICVEVGSSNVSLSIIAVKSYEMHFSNIDSTLANDVTRRQSAATGCNRLVKLRYECSIELNILTRPESLKLIETLRFKISVFCF